MKKPRRILVAIKSPGSRAQPALRKAAQLASALGARLELFHAISEPVYLDAFLLEGLTLEQTQKQWRDRLLKKLGKHAAELRASGLTVDVSCEWDFPAYEAVIRRASRTDADLIVAERHATRHMLPWLLRFNDWELLRRSPVPVLLVKRAQPWNKPGVLAAIDPLHSFAKPAKLDGDIMEAAQMAAGALGGKLHVAHAFPGAMLPAERLSPVSAELAVTLERQATREARKAFAAAVEQAGLAGARKHFVPGHAVDVIPKLAKQQHVQLVVMGAISRSGLKRLVIGNIAEQVLDALPCDVLVMKPANFKPRVKGRVRGVQLVPTPPYL
ncbi:MAG TPA: universal stress protein [Steroidobacteraceae bacterium]|nr:universal stress protein [Steroidobacteraceae bacterium]